MRQFLPIRSLYLAATLAVAVGGCDSSSSGGSAAPATATATQTPTRTETPAATATHTAMPTATHSPVATASATHSPVPTATATGVPTATATASATATAEPTATVPPTATGTPTATATPEGMLVRGSVGQIYVLNAAAGSALVLRDGAGTEVASGTADDLGSMIFRNLIPGDGYTVAATDGGPVSAAVRVTAADEHPSQEFYAAQSIRGGYGYLRTRDGTLLAINVILPPPPATPPYATVIEYSGYDPANPSAPQPSTLLTSNIGYAAVGVNMRGTGCSGGAFDFFETLQSTDGYDVVETIAAQPWVKGNKVGMVGLSYPGLSQLFVAALQPPHLKAIAPLSVISDIGRGVLYPGGILNNGFAVEWAAGRAHDAQPGGQPWSQKRIDEGDQICIANQRLRGQTPDIINKIDENDFYVPEVADPLSPTTFIDRINVPVFLGGAWQDEQTGGYFANMLSRFSGTDKLHLNLTNGGHIESLGPHIAARWMEFLSLYVAEEVPRRHPNVPFVLPVLASGVFDVPRLTLEPDRYVGVTSYDEALARFESEAPVRVLFENGAGSATAGAPVASFEQSFAAWPVPGTEAATWYFHGDGRLDVAPPVDEGVDSYLYDTSRAQKTTITGGDEWKAKPNWKWFPLDAGKALAYASEPLTETLTMVGTASVDLWFQSSAADTDVQATLSEIRPDGQEVLVQSGWLRASRRRLDEAASSPLRPVHSHLRDDAADLPAGEFVAMRVEIFPFAHVFRAGSRLRIAIDTPGGTRPRWKFSVLEPEAPVTNSVARSVAMPSKLVLPVIPGVEPPAALPPCPSLRGQPCRPYSGWSNE